MKRISLIVVGGGVGGYSAALRAARLGADVTLIEKDRIGGVCLNKGCIPSKVLLHSASIYKEMKRASLFGLTTENLKIDFSAVQARKRAVVERLTDGVASLLRNRNIRVVNGTAAFSNANTIRILETGEVLCADRFILATGSIPVRLSIAGAEKVRLLTSDDLLSLESLPSSLLIIGGGYIGVELGQFYGRMGVKVTVVEVQDRIIPTEDEEISRALEAFLSREGMTIYTSSAAGKIANEGENNRVTVSCPAGQKEILVSEVAQTVGRKPNYLEMDIEKAGITAERGRIRVDETKRTNIPHIYAIGDVTGGIMLAHVAMAEAECAARNALGCPSSISCKAVPRCVYTSPEVACVGLSEQSALGQAADVEVSRFPLHAAGRASITDETEGMVKIVADKKHGEILGVHIIGPHATELIAEAVFAMEMEATVEELANTIHPHPTLSEALKEAAMMLRGGATYLP